MRLPVNEPLMKLTPIMKLIGNEIVSLKIKFTFLVFELFWIPIINIKNKEILNDIVKNIFLNMTDIYLTFWTYIQIINYAFFNAIFFC